MTVKKLKLKEYIPKLKKKKKNKNKNKKIDYN